MKNKVQSAINILVIIFMPFMMYINFGDTKVNVALADMILVFIGIMFIINIKEFFLQKRWVYILYFSGLIFSLFLSQYISRLDKDFLHVNNSVMAMEMLKTLIVAMFFFTAYILVNSEREFRASLVTISLSSIPVMLIGYTAYIDYILVKAFFIKTYKLNTLRFHGTFEDPNLCAFYFILVFFISLLNFKLQKSKLLKFLMLSICVFSVISIMLTKSRGGWLALAVAVVVYILLNIKNLRKESLLVVLFSVIIIFMFIDIDYNFQQGRITNDLMNRVQESFGKDVGDIDRIQLLKAALSMGNDNFFFGVGKGSFPLNSYKYLSEDNVQYKMQFIPHNTILGFYSQQGIVGVLIFITLPAYILYKMIRSGRKQNIFLVPLFLGLFIQSLTINVENVRFLWYILGLMLASEKLDINLDITSSVEMNKRNFRIVFIILLLLTMILYVDVSRKMTSNIYIHSGDFYERKLSEMEPGDYLLMFDINTDAYLHTVEVYDGQELLKKMDFKSALGIVNVPIHIDEECRVVFISNKEGWARVRNAKVIGENKKIVLQNYILLPRFIEDWSNKRGLLGYIDEPSYRKRFGIESNKLNAFELLKGKVIKYSNLSHDFQFIFKSKQKVDINYQMDLMLDYHSISNILPNEDQENLWHYQFKLFPLTSKWINGEEYTANSNLLFATEGFKLYGRYYDNVNNKYIQNSYFPIKYDIIEENQKIIDLGDSKWINISYSKDNRNIIHMISNGWVESGRMNLAKGDHEITFKAQGSLMREYSKLRLRDSYLNEIAEITLDGTMKEYTIKYHTDEDQKGISFVLELINYKSEKGIGSREVLLEDWVRVK